MARVTQAGCRMHDFAARVKRGQMKATEGTRHEEREERDEDEGWVAVLRQLFVPFRTKNISKRAREGQEDMAMCTPRQSRGLARKALCLAMRLLGEKGPAAMGRGPRVGPFALGGRRANRMLGERLCTSRPRGGNRRRAPWGAVGGGGRGWMSRTEETRGSCEGEGRNHSTRELEAVRGQGGDGVWCVVNVMSICFSQNASCSSLATHTRTHTTPVGGSVRHKASSGLRSHD
jgi:hypothetical protein